MNQNEQQRAAKIRSAYLEKQPTDLDTLRALDTKVQRPANVFSYVFGSISAIIMGAGMSLVMTDIGSVIGMEATMVPGIVIGVVGMVLALVNYPLHKRILNTRKKRYASDILTLSNKIINQ